MASSCVSSISQLLCSESLPVTFAHLIREVDALLEQFSASAFKISWNSDQVATFDQPGTRVLLGWTEHPGHGLCGVLTLSVGPSPVLGKPVMRPDHEALAAHLTALMQSRLAAEDCLTHRMACVMTADWVDLLIDALPLPSDTSTHTAVLGGLGLLDVTFASIEPRLMPFMPSTHRPEDRNRHNEPRLSDLRQALHGDEPPPSNRPFAQHALLSGMNLIVLPWSVVSLAQIVLAKF